MFTGPLEDRVAITELNGIYADGVVRMDADTWSSTWAEDAVWDMMGQETGGREAIVATWKQALSGLDAVSFQTMPCMIAIEGHTATARVQTQEILKLKDGTTRHVGGLYEDELARRNGRWVFTKRSFRIVAEFGA
jgi:ketosteroid isomerase-like protein